MRFLLSGLLALALAACSPAAETSAPQTAAALTPEGPAQAIAQTELTDQLAIAAYVARVDPLDSNGGWKLFGIAGGDPAMNGLQTYLAFFVDNAEGWRVYPLGDILDYRVLNETPGRVDLEIRESVLNQATGEIGSQIRYAVITWTHGPNAEPPASLSVTAARL